VPVVLRVAGFRLFFYANEGQPREPVHVHVERGDGEAKFWISPDVRVAYNDGMDAKALREALELVEANRERIEQAWHEFFR
jgi:hypothetical protein